MFLSIGEIAKVLGMSADNIRYYVKEGLITPKKNPENNYSEFSSEDVLLISDVLYYRNLGLSIANIKKIFSGIPLEEIGDVIEDTMENLQEQIKELSRVHSHLEIWKNDYMTELSSIGKHTVSMTPEMFTAGEEYKSEDHIAKHLSEITIDKDEWMNVSVSFYIDGRVPEEEQCFKWYVSLLKTEKTMKDNLGKPLNYHQSVPCIRTCVRLSESIHEMTDGIREFAEKEGLTISGEFYGWEQTNYYEDNKRKGIYTVYAPLK